MGKRPQNGAFGALAALRGKLPAASAKPAPARSLSKATQATNAAGGDGPDDAALFRATLAGVTPLADAGRAEIARDKPLPLPRPRSEETEAEPTSPSRRRTDPDDPAALFRDAMTGVEALPDSGRVELARRPPRHVLAAQGTAYAAAVSGGEPQQPWLPDHVDDPAELFRHAVGAAQPLADRNRIEPQRPLPPPQPRQREADDASVLREAIEAPLSFQDRLETGDEGVHLRDGIPRRVLTDLRRGRWVVQAELDLHGLTRDEARTALAAFLHDALDNGCRCVRLIHGKGLGSPGREPVLKHLSRGWLMQREEILAFCQARPHDGGEGALLVLLRAPRNADRP